MSHAGAGAGVAHTRKAEHHAGSTTLALFVSCAELILQSYDLILLFYVNRQPTYNQTRCIQRADWGERHIPRHYSLLIL